MSTNIEKCENCNELANIKSYKKYKTIVLKTPTSEMKTSNSVIICKCDKCKKSYIPKDVIDNYNIRTSQNIITMKDFFRIDMNKV